MIYILVDTRVDSPNLERGEGRGGGGIVIATRLIGGRMCFPDRRSIKEGADNPH